MLSGARLQGEVSRAHGLCQISYSLLLLAREKTLRKWNAFFLLWQYEVTVTLRPMLNEYDHRACYILLSYSNTYATQSFKHLGFLTTCSLCLLVRSWILQCDIHLFVHFHLIIQFSEKIVSASKRYQIPQQPRQQVWSQGQLCTFSAQQPQVWREFAKETKLILQLLP